MRRIIGIVLAVLLIGGVAAAVVAGREPDKNAGKSAATKTVRGVIGSEKAEFFADPDVVKALATKGFTVKTETSGSWAMEEMDLTGDDFAFPSSTAPAGGLEKKYQVRGGPLRPFYSPLVVVTHRSTAQVLAANGLATLDGPSRGTLRMGPYLDARGQGPHLAAAQGRLDPCRAGRCVSITSTDPETSNSGALYLAAASYVANGEQGRHGRRRPRPHAPLLQKLTAVQGAQQTSSDGPFRDFISGVGQPLVLVYESQVASLLLQHQDVGDMVVLYPDTTVNSDHTVVPLTENGRKLGELLATDKAAACARDTARLPSAGRHGRVRRGDSPVRALSQPDAGRGHQASVPTTEILHKMARQARS